MTFLFLQYTSRGPSSPIVLHDVASENAAREYSAKLLTESQDVHKVEFYQLVDTGRKQTEIKWG